MTGGIAPIRGGNRLQALFTLPATHTRDLNMRTLYALIVAVTLPFALANASHADTLIMKGGDRLSGSVVDLQGDVLTFKTSYSGKIPVKWSEVASLETTGTARFKLRDGTVMQAQAKAAADSTVVLRSGEIITTAPIALTDVTYINPPPEVTGEGLSMSGRANLGFSASRGNTDNSQLMYDVEAVARGVDNRVTVGAMGVQKNEDGEETARNNHAYLKYDHFYAKRWYGYANTGFEEDRFKDLNLRATLGVGTGYQFFESELQNLSLEGGLTYVNEDFDTGEDEGFAAGRWALRYDRFLFGTTTQFFHTHEGLLSVEDAKDFLWQSQTGLRFPLIKDLNATVQYNIDYDNQPTGDAKKTDSAYIMSVGYEW